MTEQLHAKWGTSAVVARSSGSHSLRLGGNRKSFAGRYGQHVLAMLAKRAYPSCALQGKSVVYR